MQTVETSEELRVIRVYTCDVTTNLNFKKARRKKGVKDGAAGTMRLINRTYLLHVETLIF